MQHLSYGIRAGIFSALILTLWSFSSVAGVMDDAPMSVGFSYVVVAYGLLGLPQILYGLALGFVASGWSRALSAEVGEHSLRRWLEEPEWNRRAAAMLLLLPVAIGGAAILVAGTHLTITSKFVRAVFQAVGLGAVTGGVLLAGVALLPFLYAALSRVIGLLFRGKVSESSRAVTSILWAYGVGAVFVLAAAYKYASGLQVWSPSLLRMAVAGSVLTPSLIVALSRLDSKTAFWRYGFPLAGLIIAVVCAFFAPKLAVSGPEMRQVVFQDSHLLAATARIIVPLPGANDGGAVFAFADCDDESDPRCKDADVKEISLSSKSHPARRSVALAIEAGKQSAVNQFQQTPKPPKNLVFILIDTLRQDHLGYAGYERKTSPHIDQIASESVVFLDTYATSPHTPRSIPPMLFSQYASRMMWAGAQYNYPRVRPENLGLFEVLQERGWKNIGMTSHFYFSERQGIRQGFDVWDNEGAGTIAESNDDIAAPRIWEKLQPVISDLGRQQREKGEDSQPFSLFIHLFEPHARWIAHSEFDFGKGETVRERHINSYDSEIAYTDSYIAKIVTKLKEEGLYDNSILVISSDHGEAFNEHGHYFHGQTLYNEVIKVPLIVRVPGWNSRRVEGPVSIIDVAPTVLDLMAVTIPPDFAGISLTDIMLGRSEPPLRPLFAELLPYTSFKEHIKTVIYGQEKFIKNYTLGLEEFYDLAEDPGEQTNLRTRQRERADKLQEMLKEFAQ